MGRAMIAETRETDLLVSFAGEANWSLRLAAMSPRRSTPINELGAGALEYVDLLFRKTKSVL